MKKQLLLILCAILLAPAINSFAQSNLIKGGNMEDPAAWNAYWGSNAGDTGEYEFNYTGDVPTAGSDGCYRVKAAGQAANMLWQPVKLVPGHRYLLTGAYKYIADTSINVWVEYFLTRVKPNGGEISTAIGYSLNTWMWADAVNLDGTFQDDFSLANTPAKVIQIPDTCTQFEWYVALKAGCWNGAGDVTPVFELLFDELSLVDVTVESELVKGGNMEDPTAWNAYWNTFDAVDTGTYEFNYTTDGPSAGSGGCYRVTAAGQAANMLWQPVKILPGHKYSLTGAYKYLADTAVNVWVELFITRIKPKGRSTTESGEISTAQGYSLNTWMAPNNVNLDGTFQEDFAYAGGVSQVIEIPDTVTQTEWYLAFKAGCWNGAGDVSPVYDVAIDDISLIDLSQISAGGNMEDPSKWNVYWNTFDAVDTGVYEFNYTDDVPSAGSGGCYRVSAAGQAANMLWQPVTIIPGHNYKLEGAYKYIADTAVNVWVEYFITRIKPKGRSTTESGEITTAQGYSLNTWMYADAVNLDGTFQDDFAVANIKAPVFLMPDTVTQTEWYLAMKAGCWNAAGDTAPVYDLLFDEIYMYDLGAPKVTVLPVNKVVYGAVDSPEDFTGTVTMSWDADSVYMVYDAVDDSIVNGGTSYQVDNIEVYFDMDNSKNIHWPRNGGWLKAIDDAYDDNDYQLRLVPDVAFATNNSPRPAAASVDPATVNQIYTLTEGGFQIVLNVPWSTLMADFVPEANALIGFDVLWSDNDATASDANRNQLTWNTPTPNPYNDPSLFGVLRLVKGGTFEPVADVTKPTAPANVLATVNGADVVITWDASTDDRVVQNYIIYSKTTAIDTVLAKQTGNSYKATGLDPTKTYTFGVAAMDLYGNKSAKTSAAPISGINNLTQDGMMVYPNPSDGVFNIVSDGNASVSLEVYNLTGGLVTSNVFIQNHTLDLSKYSKGVYFLHLTVNGKTQITKLIVQ
jgi:hypothetical protein